MLLPSPSRSVLSATNHNPPKARILLKLFAWGAGATIAVAGAVVAGRTELGAKRAQAALAALMSPPTVQDQQFLEQMNAWSNGLDKQMRRQAEIIRTLTDQRDHLSDQVDVMERQIQDLGSSVSRMTARAEADPKEMRAALPVSPAGLPRLTPTARADDPEMTANGAMGGAPSGAMSGAATVLAAPPRGLGQIAPLPRQTAPSNFSATGEAGRIAAPLPNLLASEPDAAASVLPPPAAVTMPVRPGDAVTPLPRVRPWPASGPQGGPVEPAAIHGLIPLPLPRPNAARAAQAEAPAREAAFPAANPLMTVGVFDSGAPPGVAPGEFAVDLGSAPTVEALRKRWNDLRANQSPLLDNLKPLVALKTGGKSGQELHLVAGPLPNTAAATRLCGFLSGESVPCQATGFDGQRLAQR